MHPYKEIYKRQQMGTANKTSRKREPVNICTNGSHFQCHNTIAKRKITIQKTHLSDKTSTSRKKKKKKRSTMNLQLMAKMAKREHRTKLTQKTQATMRGEKSGYKLKVNSTNRPGESIFYFFLLALLQIELVFP